MIPNPKVMDVVEGGLDDGHEVIQARFDQDSIAHLMSVMTNLYSDPLSAVIREYSTNAWDAHVEAGIDRPIEVSAPSRLSAFLRIRDFGRGLSLQDLRDVYSVYGASTKRGSNDFNGMLGLGTKSGLAYSGQFSLVSVHGGERHVVSITFGDTGVLELHVVESTPTTDHSGVQVIIPIKTQDVERTSSLLKSFYSYWPRERILLNGDKVPEFNFGDEVSPGIFVSTNRNPMGHQGHQADRIVMGGVAYPIPNDQNKTDAGLLSEELAKSSLRSTVFITAFVEIGAVTFAPARESLQMVSSTNRTIEDIRARVSETLISSVQSKIDECATFPDSIREAYSLRGQYGARFVSEQLRINGQVIGDLMNSALALGLPDTAMVCDLQPGWGEHPTVSSYSGGDTISASSLFGIKSSPLDLTVLYNGPRRLSPRGRSALKQAIDEQKCSRNVLILNNPSPLTEFWARDVKQMDWKDFLREFPATPDSPEERKFTVHDRNATTSRAVPADEKTVALLVKEARTLSRRGLFNSFAKHAFDMGYSVSVIYANQYDSFVRNHPRSTTMKLIANSLMDKLEGARLQYESHAHAASRSSARGRWYLALSLAMASTSVEDPDVRKFLNDFTNPTPANGKDTPPEFSQRDRACLASLASLLGRAVKQETTPPVASDVIQERYGLVNSIIHRLPYSNRDTELTAGMVEYMNMKFKVTNPQEEKEEKS